MFYLRELRKRIDQITISRLLYRLPRGSPVNFLLTRIDKKNLEGLWDQPTYIGINTENILSRTQQNEEKLSKNHLNVKVLVLSLSIHVLDDLLFRKILEHSKTFQIHEQTRTTSWSMFAIWISKKLGLGHHVISNMIFMIRKHICKQLFQKSYEPSDLQD